MNSKLSRPQQEANNVAINPQLRRSYVDPLQGLGHLSNLHSENRSQGPPLSTAYLQQAGRMNGGTYQHIPPPPLPPRQNTMNRYGYAGHPGMSRYSRINDFYNPLGTGRYSSPMYSNSMYSPISNYRMPYGHFGAPNNESNSFFQMAEESTRPAFESIESVVHTVNSISMMLESTYGAVHSSYSAILGVVDQFSRLKDHFSQVFSVLAMLKGLHYLCLKVLYLLGLRKSNPAVEEAWQTAQKAAVNGNLPPNISKGSVWPFFMFLSLVIGAPWLMFKLLSKNNVKKPFDRRMWLNSEGKKLKVTAGYDFVATQFGELSFKTGEILILSPQDLEEVKRTGRKWVLACNNRNESGLIPMTYLNSVSRATPSNRQKTVNSQPLPFLNADSSTEGPNISDITPDVKVTAPGSNSDDPQNRILNPSQFVIDSTSASVSSDLVQSHDSVTPSASSLNETDSASISTLDPVLASISSLKDTESSSHSLKENSNSS